MMLFLFFFVAFLWGGSFIAIKMVVATVPPFWAGGIRLAVALVLLHGYLKLKKIDLKLAQGTRSQVWLSGFFSQGLPFALLFWGEQSISPGLGGILNGTSPLWAFVFGIFFLSHDEPFTKKKLLGLLLGMAGLLFIFGPKLSLGISNSSTLGTLAVGLMSVSYGGGVIINRALMLKSNAPRLDVSLYHQTLISAVFVIILALVFEGAPHLSWFGQPQFLIATLYMSWFSTAFAFLVYFKLIQEWGALRASSVAYLLPLSAVLLDFLINSNVPSTTDVVGSVIILAGVLLLQGRV